MALNALTLTVSSGVQGRHFKAAVAGMTAGNLVEVMPGSAPGFGYSNGFLTNPSLGYDVNLAILRERNETTGETRTTNLLITATGLSAIQQQALSISGSYRSYRAAAVPSGNGSHVWYVFVEDPTGATTSALIGNTALSISGTPPPTVVQGVAYSFTPTTSGGSGAQTFALTGSLPTGLSFSTSTGAITGTPTTVQTATGLNITVTDSSGSAALGVFSIAVTAATLGTLTLSGSLQIGVATSGTIIGATPGSTITGNIPGITVNSAARTYSSTPTGSAQTISNGLVEALTGATNTPHNSSVTVAAAAVTLADLTVSPLTATAGTAWSGTISGKTSGSTITAVASDGTTLTVSGTTVSGTFSGAGSPTIALTETLAGATNTPHTSPSQTVVVSAAGGALTASGAPSAAKIGTSYSFVPSITGGTGPYTVSLTAGALPAGLTLSNTSTGAITGTPTGI